MFRSIVLFVLLGLAAGCASVPAPRHVEASTTARPSDEVDCMSECLDSGDEDCESCARQCLDSMPSA